MMTGAEYRASLRTLKRTVYYQGERIEDVVAHPATRPHVNAAAATYDFACDPKTADLGAATSHLTGERINR
ncbi:MAG: 4-hydroxybutyryl-CoA dehydratase, partial [Planctomycetes bacterium]|nr:4-hydroxybutyryl-CoA dehydratase [Planctomycetota bacterium]